MPARTIHTGPDAGNGGYGKRVYHPSVLQAGNKKAILRSKTLESVPRIASKQKPQGRRVSPGTRALQDCRRLQRCTALMIPHQQMRRVIQEELNAAISMERWDAMPRLPKVVIDILQEVAEKHLCQLMEKAQMIAIHSGRITLRVKDLQHLLKLTDQSDLGIERT